MKDSLFIAGGLVTMASTAGLFVQLLGLGSVALLITFLLGIILIAGGQIKNRIDSKE